ncbi:alpha-2-macroglobulin-like isoform X2 [Pecten maximus]|uniref:alpha-2-macroglobulin-like isoform X2 n=1 Tax=Pecten maximus TaxID=6579 RepID=UPI001458AE8D|nr:alpha-2-macroglobulin-like isoform X2 [Pecten maximus]
MGTCSGRWSLFLIAMVAVLPIALSTNSTYIVTAPAKARRGYQYTVNVALLMPANPSTVEASVLDVSDQVVVGPVSANFAGVVANEQKLMTLSVPTSLTAGKYYLKVESKSGVSIKVKQDLQVLAETGLIMIQTDKKVYKEGQTVHIRGAVLSSDAKPLGTNLDVIIADPNANKLAHYKGLTPDLGVVAVDFELVNDPTFGEWSITIMATNTPEIVTEKQFKVEKYVLPKFSVAATLSPFVKVFPGQSSGQLTVDVVAKYTYGKPVNGKAVMLVNIGNNPQIEEKTLVNGMITFTTTVSQSEVVTFRYRPRPEVSVKVTVVEDVTGKEEAFEGSVPLHLIPYKMDFINDDGSFLYAMPNNIFVKITDVVGGSIPVVDRASLGVRVKFVLSKRWTANTELLPPLSLTMPDTGDVIAAQVDVPTKVQMENQSFSMVAELTYPSMDSNGNPNTEKLETGTKYKYPVTTKTSLGVSVSVVGITQQVQSPETAVPAGQAVTFQVMTTVSSSVFYEVYAKGLLLVNGIVSPTETSTGLYSANFDVAITSKMAPNAVVVVYTNTATDEIVADAQSFSVSGLLKHRLSARFDSNLKQVGDTASLTVVADPNSVVFVGAIDKSAALLGEPNKIDLAGLLEALEDFDLISKPREDDTDWGCGGCGIMFKRKRRDVEMVRSNSGVTTAGILRDAGVMMITDSVITDYEFIHNMPEIMEDGIVAMAPVNADANMRFKNKESDSSGSQDSVAVRKNFPETWIWTGISVGSSGSNTSDFPVPDTITSWDINAFSMNANTGMDLAMNMPSLTVMKQMFVSLEFPLTVKRGEKFKLNIYVFNYYNNPLTADVTLSAPLEESFGVFPLEYTKEILEDESQAKAVAVTKTGLTVPSNSSAGFFLWIYPKVIGNIKLRVSAVSPKKTDIVEQSLLVEPEGKTSYGASSMSIKHEVDQTADFVMEALPAEGAVVVEGSKSNYITVTGDVMGPTIENLDSLVRQPSGCGEQNMITLVPSIFVRKYVEAVKDVVDQSLVERTNKYMESGYQREQNYKHADASYSAFGKSDNSGSSWLTAFVVKSFAMSKQFIPVTVDDADISKSVTWLLNQINKDFIFDEPGRVIHTEMQGGSTSEFTLAAYIYISLKETKEALPGLNVPNFDNKLSQVLTALQNDYTRNKDAWVQDKKFFRLAILAYSFALGGSSLTSDVLQTLESLAQDQDGMMYWSIQKESVYKDNGRVYCSLPSGPSDIETASYAILAYTKLDNVTKGQRVLKWLMSQINSAGSFHSTQDTVMGLQAIAGISILIGRSSAGMNLAVQYTVGGVTNTLTINDNNKYLLQKEKLPDDTTDVTFSVTGKGVALLSLLWKYNVLADAQNSRPKFSIETNTVAVNVNVFDVIMDVTLLDSGETGEMGLISYQAPSGFSTNTDTIKGASRVENVNGNVVIYIAGVETGKKQFRLQSFRTQDVADIKKGIVTAQLYYKPESSSLVTYDIPDMVKLTACQLSGDKNDECPLPRNPNGASAATPTKLLLGLVSVLLLLTNLN